jgi:hypothetical protein
MPSMEALDAPVFGPLVLRPDMLLHAWASYRRATVMRNAILIVTQVSMLLLPWFVARGQWLGAHREAVYFGMGTPALTAMSGCWSCRNQFQYAKDELRRFRRRTPCVVRGSGLRKTGGLI